MLTNTYRPPLCYFFVTLVFSSEVREANSPGRQYDRHIKIIAIIATPRAPGQNQNSPRFLYLMCGAFSASQAYAEHRKKRPAKSKARVHADGAGYDLYFERVVAVSLEVFGVVGVHPYPGLGGAFFTRFGVCLRCRECPAR